MAGRTIQSLSDELEIRDLLARTAHASDAGSVDEYMSSFAPDAILEMSPPAGTAASAIPPTRGHAALRAGAQARRDAGMTGPGTRARHNVTTTVVSIDGDHATASSCVLVASSQSGTPQLSFAGTYSDEFVRTASGWKISRRVITAN